MFEIDFNTLSQFIRTDQYECSIKDLKLLDNRVSSPLKNINGYYWVENNNRIRFDFGRIFESEQRLTPIKVHATTSWDYEFTF